MSLKAFTPAIMWLLSTAPICSSRADRGATTVYLCEGPQSHVYHYSQTCRGLRKCSTKLHKMTLEEAIRLGRRACGYEKK